MDILIKCYLDQYSSSPRNTLHDRRNRQAAVDYISTLIEGCSRGTYKYYFLMYFASSSFIMCDLNLMW